MYYLAYLVGAIILLHAGEGLSNETKESYIESGRDWNKVIKISNIVAVISGLISIIVLTLKGESNMNEFLLPFAVTITAYITAQSIMTDMTILKINRNILRVAYVSMYIFAVFNVYTVEEFRFNLTALILFTTVTILLFLFSPIGASDVRAMAVALPFIVSMGGYLAIEIFIIVLLMVSVGMMIKRQITMKKEIEIHKKKYPEDLELLGEKDFIKATKRTIKQEFKTDKKYAEPVGPFMIAPFLIYLIIYPLL